MTVRSLLRSALLGGAALTALAATGASAQETTTTWRGAPQFANDALTFKVRGRVYLDYVNQDVEGDGLNNGIFSGSNTPDFDSNNTRVRTARIGVEGTYSDNWAYKAEATLASQGSNGAQWEDLILEYKPDDFSSILIGNFKTLGLEQITSSRYITFMERGPYADVTDTGRVLNIAYKRNGTNYTGTVAVSGGSINDTDVLEPNSTNIQGDERLGVNGRLTYAPIDTDDLKVHTGVWARYRTRGDEGAFNYQARPNTGFGNRFVATGGIGDEDTTIGLEGAVVYRNYSVQAEAANIKFDRIPGVAGNDGDIQTAYVFASWFPTGEYRRYEANRGEFNRVRILNPTTTGGFGAFELAARYEYVDLTEAFLTTRSATTGATTAIVNPRAGVQNSYTAGVNWYPIPYVRFQANYTFADADAKQSSPTGAQFADADVNTFQVRAQFDF